MHLTLIIVSILVSVGTKAKVDAAELLNDEFSPKCQSAVCDEKPVCPQTSCDCIYTSRVECDVYYKCIKGQVRRYRCSPGLLMNPETSTCDYSENVKCDVMQTTSRPAEKETTTSDMEMQPDISQTKEAAISTDTVTVQEIQESSLFSTIEIPGISFTKEKFSTASAATGAPTATVSAGEPMTVESTRASKTIVDSDLVTTPGIPKTKSTREWSKYILFSEIPTNLTNFITTNLTKVPYNDITDEITEIRVTSDVPIFSVTKKPDNVATTEIPKIEVTSEVPMTEETTIILTTKIATERNTAESSEKSVPFMITDAQNVSGTSNNNTIEKTRDTTETFLVTNKKSESIETTKSSIFGASKTENTVKELTSSKIPVETTRLVSKNTKISTVSLITEISENATNIKTESSSTDNPIILTTNVISNSTNFANKSTPLLTREASAFSTAAKISSAVTEKSTLDTDMPSSLSQNTEIDATTLESNITFICPSYFGLFSDPTDCGKFYHCSHSIPYQKVCSAPLHFNPELLVCDWPYRAGCNATRMSSRPTDNETTTTTMSRTSNEELQYSTSYTNETGVSTNAVATPIAQESSSFLKIETPEASSTKEKFLTTSSVTEIPTAIISEVLSTVKSSEVPNTKINYVTSATGLSENMPTTVISSEPPKTTDTADTSNFVPISEILATNSAEENQTLIVTYKEPGDGTTAEILETKVTSKMPTTGEITMVITTEITTEPTDVEPSGGSVTFMTADVQNVSGTSNIHIIESTQDTTAEKALATSKKSEIIETVKDSTISDISKSETTVEEWVTSKIPVKTTKLKNTTVVLNNITVSTVSSITKISENTSDLKTANFSVTDQVTVTTNIIPNSTTFANTSAPLLTREASAFSTAAKILTTVTERSISDSEISSSTRQNSEIDSTTVESDVTFTCPSYFGLFPDPTDCRKFYHCSHSVPYQKICSSYLQFNPDLLVCDWSYRAGCNLTQTSLEPGTENGIMESTETEVDETLMTSTVVDFPTTKKTTEHLKLSSTIADNKISNNTTETSISSTTRVTGELLTETLNFDIPTSTLIPEALTTVKTSEVLSITNTSTNMINTEFLTTMLPIEMSKITYNTKLSSEVISSEFPTTGDALEVPRTEPATEIPTTTVESEVQTKIKTTDMPIIASKADILTKINTVEIGTTMVETEVSMKTITSEIPMTTAPTEIPTKLKTPKIPVTKVATEMPTKIKITEVPKTMVTTKVPIKIMSTEAPTTLVQSKVPMKILSNETPTTLMQSKVPITLKTSKDSVNAVTSEKQMTKIAAEETTSIETVKILTTDMVTGTQKDTDTSNTQAISEMREFTKENIPASNETAKPTLARETVTNPKINIITETLTSKEIFENATTKVEQVSHVPMTETALLTPEVSEISLNNKSSSITSWDDFNIRTTNAVSNSSDLSNDSVTITTREASTLFTTSRIPVTVIETNITGNEVSTSTSQNPELPATTDQPQMKFICPFYYGLFPDPTNCEKFYHCSHFIPYHKTCPSYLHFNPNLLICDWPYRAGCKKYNEFFSKLNYLRRTVKASSTY